MPPLHRCDRGERSGVASDASWEADVAKAHGVVAGKGRAMLCLVRVLRAFERDP